MKQYVVTTSDRVNQHGLHHINAWDFSSESLTEARECYEKEVAHLRSEHEPVDWDFVEQDPHGAVSCMIITVNPGNEDDGEIVEVSEYFHIPE